MKKLQQKKIKNPPHTQDWRLRETNHPLKMLIGYSLYDKEGINVNERIKNNKLYASH